MVFFTYPMPYEVYLPGGVDSAQEFVEFENAYPSSGSFNSAYVSVITKPSPFQYTLAKLNKKAVISAKMSDEQRKIPINEILKKDNLMKISSIHNALILAYETSGNTLSYTSNGVVIIDRIIDTPAYESLEVGDIITKINHEDIEDYLEAFDIISSIGCNEPFYLTIYRDNKEVTLNIEKEERENKGCILGLSQYDTYTNYIFDSTKSNPKFNLIDTSGYGPSAGLIQTLSIYNMLTPIDITYGLKIAGTGTIDINGNVGIIGGVEHKVFGACKANVDIFFAPDFDYGENGAYNNYRDAIKARDIMKSDMIIVPVKTFDDAINYLMANYG